MVYFLKDIFILNGGHNDFSEFSNGAYLLQLSPWVASTKPAAKKFPMLRGSYVLTNDPVLDPRSTRPILLVEDDREFAVEIQSELEKLGHQVCQASMAEAADTARVGGAALLIVDRLIFGVDCLPGLQLLRSQNIKVPVLVISILSSAEEIVRGLKAGGDDYLAKPFSMAELGARVEALLRRLDGARLTNLKVGDFEMDLIETAVYCAGEKLDLLPREFELLKYFLRHPGQVVTRAMLIQDVWKYHFSTDASAVDAHISNLRRKIDKDGIPSQIVNIRGAGFTLRKSS
jgi:two-component system OmpR family response regulator